MDEEPRPMRLSWGRMDPEVGALLPRTLDALETALRDRPELFPRSAATGKRLDAGVIRRGPDGRACGPLLAVGGCMSTLKDVPGGMEPGRYWSAIPMSGTVSEPPMDDFHVVVLRQPDEETFRMGVSVPTERNPARRVGGGLLSRPSWECTGISGQWSTRGLRDEDVAHMLGFALDLRAEGKQADELLVELYIERVQLAVRVRKELGRDPDDEVPAVPAMR